MKRRSPYILLAALLSMALPSGCAVASDNEPVRRYVQSMDTLITLTAYGEGSEEALDLAEKEIVRLDELLSTGLPGSEISQINAAKSAVLSDDAYAIVKKALELYQDTDGLFDITIYPLMQLWGFATTVDASIADDPIARLLSEDEHDYHVPTDEELEKTLPLIGSDRLSLEEESRTLTLGEGQSIDLGGIAKGYASSKIMEVFREAGLTSGMVSLGGNVQCLGKKPNGKDYVIAIRDPFGSESDYAATMTIENEAVITSGGYERFFEDPGTGKIYQHIMDPETGYPAESDLVSVTIVTSDGMLGDGLSTSLYIMGLEEATGYWRDHADEFQMILIDQAGTLYITEDLVPQILTPQDYEILPLQEGSVS